MNRRAFLKALVAGGVAAAAPAAVLGVLGMAPRQISPMPTGGFVDATGLARLHTPESIIPARAVPTEHFNCRCIIVQTVIVSR